MRLDHHCGRYCEYFKTKTRDAGRRALQYLRGQLQVVKPVNMTNIPKTVPGSDNQSLQHFISQSTWDDKGAITELQSHVSEVIGDPTHGSLHIDESAFEKQGKDSVGVARQHNGRRGKVDNCQVGVFLGYACNGYRTLIDKRLYLPKKWIDDPERRKKCGVPKDLEFKTKAQLGWEMLQRAKKRSVPFGWVGMDSFYGEQPWLLEKCDANDITYIADIACNTRVWLEKPRTEVPPRRSKYGRKPKRERVCEGEPRAMEVQKIARLPSLRWQRIFIRDTQRKELWAQVACLRVYPVRDTLPGTETWLIIRKNEGEKDTKYQLSNAAPDTPVEKLAEMSASRYWIERALQDAKGEVGMADYQVRGWWGWHHHMTMTFLAMIFLVTLFIEMQEKAPALTIQDVRETLEVILPRRHITHDEMLDILYQKANARASARRSHHKQHKKKRSQAKQ